MSRDDLNIRWIMKNYCVDRSMAEYMIKDRHIEFWETLLKIMIHIGEEYYFTPDGKIHPKYRIKAKKTDRTMV